ncbi:hypothetical protein AXG93_1976s1160 [Marchantia polymorpha subsp. ruderalis]|uniref:Uncharacterized protein n=1 Tax=Marchantia polymorpha subsp. ruderalis TaxID=1480154 RepID=A0A176VEV1_MARPO|nr:hypothetical protein AXG93_1976s1160 [Marchantia polymorpha subsp. ruderalis]
MCVKLSEYGTAPGPVVALFVRPECARQSFTGRQEIWKSYPETVRDTVWIEMVHDDPFANPASCLFCRHGKRPVHPVPGGVIVRVVIKRSSDDRDPVNLIVLHVRLIIIGMEFKLFTFCCHESMSVAIHPCTPSCDVMAVECHSPKMYPVVQN